MRTLRIISIHCQSKFASVGNSANAGCFVSFQVHNIRPHAGPIRRFQKTGTVSSGGLVQSRLALRGMNKTFPPVFNLDSASSQELVTKTSFGIAVSVFDG